MMAIYRIKEERRRLGCGDLRWHKSKMNHLAELIDEDENSRLALGITRQTKDEFHADQRPRSCCDW